jgi:hypothetical protein
MRLDGFVVVELAQHVDPGGALAGGQGAIDRRYENQARSRSRSNSILFL